MYVPIQIDVCRRIPNLKLMPFGDANVVMAFVQLPQEMLKPPPWEAWGVPRDRIVLSVHMYAARTWHK